MFNLFQVLNANYFGNSWVVPDYVTQHSECSPNCTETNDTACTQEERQSAKLACDKIFKRNGKFKVSPLKVIIWGSRKRS